MQRRDAAGLVAGMSGALVVVPALALTLARLSGSTTGVAVRLEAFAPLGIPLYAAAVLLLTGWVLTRADGRRWPVAATVAALTGLVVHLWWFAPMLRDSAPDAAPGAPTVTVVDANLLFGGADVVPLLEAAEEAAASGDVVLVLEEVTRPAVEALDRAGAGTLLPHRAGGPRPDPGDRTGGTMVLSTLPLSRVTPIPTRFDSYTLQVGTGEEALTLLAVHPYPPPDSSWQEDFAALHAAAERHHPDLVVGDLNATPDHAPLRDLLDTGLRDAVELTGGGFRPTWPDHGLGPLHLPRLVQIDHVLVGADLTVRTVRTLEVPRSDHRAVVAQVARR